MDTRLAKAGTCLLATVVLAACAAPLGHAPGKSRPTPGNGPRGIITTFAGSLGTGAAMALSIQPEGIAVSGNRLFITEPSRQIVRLVDLTTGQSTIFAGTGVAGSRGDGGPATQAQLDDPEAIATDSAGNVFIGDGISHRVRRVGQNGIIATVAGTGVAGYSGDGGPATAAQIDYPSSLATDQQGNLYIADSARVRKVTRSGVISTVPTADAIPVAIAVSGGGELYILDIRQQVLKLTSTGAVITVAGGGGPATAASLHLPIALAVDPFGDLFVGDIGTVREVDASGSIHTVVTADYKNQVDIISGLASDDQGNLFIADKVGYHVRKLARTGQLSIVAGNGDMNYSGEAGPATGAQLGEPWGMVVDAQGNVDIADYMANRVLRVVLDGTIHTVVAGGPCCHSAGSGQVSGVSQPSDLALDPEGTLYIADRSQALVLKLDSGGNLSAFAGIGLARPGSTEDGVPATSVLLFPEDIAADAAGNVYVADGGSGVIRKIDSRGIITSVAADLHLRQADGLSVDRAGNLFISDASLHQVFELQRNGTSRVVAGSGFEGSSGDGGPAIAATLITPEGLAFDQKGDLFIADAGADVIRRVDPHGVITTVAGNGKVGRSGDGGPAVLASLNDPRSVAVDAQGNLFIADQGNRVIRRVQGPIP